MRTPPAWQKKTPVLIEIAAFCTLVIVVKAPSPTQTLNTASLSCEISRTTQSAKLTAQACLIEEKTAANGQRVKVCFNSGYWGDSQGHTRTKLTRPALPFFYPSLLPTIWLIVADLCIGYATLTFLCNCLRCDLLRGEVLVTGRMCRIRRWQSSEYTSEIKPVAASHYYPVTD